MTEIDPYEAAVVRPAAVSALTTRGRLAGRCREPGLSFAFHADERPSARESIS